MRNKIAENGILFSPSGIFKFQNALQQTIHFNKRTKILCNDW